MEKIDELQKEIRILLDNNTDIDYQKAKVLMEEKDLLMKKLYIIRSV